MTQHDDRRDARGGLSRLRRPRLLPYAAALVVASIAVASGSAARGPALAAPSSLQTFMKRIGEPRKLSGNGIPEYSRTPSFAWAAVRGASHYEFELSTSGDFRSGNGLVWQSRTLTTPATSIPLALPWITGQPASLHWRVRAVNAGSVSSWSQPNAFNMGTVAPKELKPARGSYADRPGYVRWTPVDGATGYQVLFLNVGANAGLTSWTKLIETITNVADEREYYAFHDDPSWTSDVDWRVRAMRRVYGATKNALPAVSYGPWSPVYHWKNSYDALGTSATVAPVASVSDQVSYKGRAQVHSLTPGLLFAGNGDTNFGLHRIYLFSDQGCVNVVYKGAIVGGPAYAPRTSGPLDLPKTDKDWFKAPFVVLKDGSEGDYTFADDTTKVRTSESPALEQTDSGSQTPTASASIGNRKVDLWDRGWPSGRYYWTVVPVWVELVPDDDTNIPIDGSDSGEPTSFHVEYHETALSQDQCEHARVVEFGKQSVNPKPVDARSVPYATGLAPTGRLLSANAKDTQFYGPPLVSWDAAPAAVAYDVEWSRTSYPWRRAGALRTYATSAVLPIAPGSWFYRVRGINDALPGIQAMSWSSPVPIRIAAPKFAVVGG